MEWDARQRVTSAITQLLNTTLILHEKDRDEDETSHVINWNLLTNYGVTIRCLWSKEYSIDYFA